MRAKKRVILKIIDTKIIKSWVGFGAQTLSVGSTKKRRSMNYTPK